MTDHIAKLCGKLTATLPVHIEVVEVGDDVVTLKSTLLGETGIDRLKAGDTLNLTTNLDFYFPSEPETRIERSSK